MPLAHTKGFEVKVDCRYIPEQSDPTERKYFFAYTIEIRNVASQPARLTHRHWIITDGWGGVEEVKGEGVVGKQPRLQEGQSFTYTSFCPITTPTGTMHGTFLMITDSGEQFDIEVPQFFLYEPSSVN